MSEEQERAQEQEQQQTRYGSRLARMFGYIRPEDRTRWEQERAQNKKNVSAARHGMKSGVGSMMDFGRRNVDSKLNAVHRMHEQQIFDEGHDKKLTQHLDPHSQSIVESVHYTEKDDSDDIEPDLGF